MSVIVPPLVIVPSAAALSIFSIAPAVPRNITHTPHAIVSDSCMRGFINFPHSKPKSPPATIAAAFTIVPSPGNYIAPSN